MAIKTVKT